MSTLFPGAIDVFTNPTSSSNMNDVGVLHADQHANANDAINALQVVVGVSETSDTNSLTYKLAGKQSLILFAAPPATAGSAGTAGQVVVSGGFAYFCVATNSWVRAATATW
jgi:hypothetical protein